MAGTSAIIDDLSREPPLATVGSSWRLITDQVMGGVSVGTMRRETIAGRTAIRVQGEVRLENGGGFLQIALDLSPTDGLVDASAWHGIELDVFGNDPRGNEEYAVHLRTDASIRPWQSYRQCFTASAAWRTVQLPFDRFVAHRTEAALDTRRLRRIGVVAIGRAFSPDLALGGLRFMAAPRRLEY
ncbi:MAG: CIA30 family protein [Gammaproteobacteria bacterium]|nr:CIA30 family protein [Gammaproteobacteria bacterium]